MSNHFVSGGTIGPDGEAFKDEGNEANPPVREAPKNAEWEAVQQELEADRKRRDEQRRKAATGEEKSLYDILQANKGSCHLPRRAFFIVCVRLQRHGTNARGGEEANVPISF